MKTKFGLVGLFVIVAIMLTACEIGVTTKVNADGSGEMGAVFKFTKDEATAYTSMAGGTVDTLCDSMNSSSTGLSEDNMAYTQETHGDEIWCVAKKTFASLDEIGQGDSSMTINTAEIKNGKFTLDADFNMGQSYDASSLSMITSSGYKITMYYEIIAPGKIDKATAVGFDTINGDTAHMTIIDTANKVTPPSSGTIHVHLESGTKGGGSSSSSGGVSLTSKKVAGVPLWGIIVALCCCLLLVVIIVVVVFYVMRKKPKQPAV